MFVRACAAAALALLVLIWPAAEAAGQKAPFDADVGLDPGHSYADVGAAGGGLREFELTLDIAERARLLLETRGYSVNLSRVDLGPLSGMSHPNADERTRIEQEARIARVGRVRCYVSIHFNGSNDPRLAGTETYYNPENEGERSWRLAESLQRHMVNILWEAGYQDRDRGVKSDLLAGKPYGHFFSLRGPFPSVLGEALFLSNPTEASLLARDNIRQDIAEGYSRGISEYLAAEASPAALDSRTRSAGTPSSRYLSTINMASRTIAPDIFD